MWLNHPGLLWIWIFYRIWSVLSTLLQLPTNMVITLAFSSNSWLQTPHSNQSSSPSSLPWAPYLLKAPSHNDTTFLLSITTPHALTLLFTSLTSNHSCTPTTSASPTFYYLYSAFPTRLDTSFALSLRKWQCPNYARANNYLGCPLMGSELTKPRLDEISLRFLPIL